VLDDGRHRVESRFVLGDRQFLAHFETGQDVPFLDGNFGDLWVAPALVIAMRHGVPLKLADPVSEGRSEHLNAIQDTFTTWYPERMTKTAIKDPWRLQKFRRHPPDQERLVGACFSGGVDSFYTLIRNRERIGALVYGFGLDVPATQPEFAAKVDAMLDAVSEESGVPVLRAHTNVRRLLEHFRVRWGSEGHGAALASLGTAFSAVIRQLLVPSTHSHDDHMPWGSHPLLDHHWSTDRLEVVYDGAEADRVKKTELIAGSQLAQRHLRVCFSQFKSMNCGRCEKCLRTMTTLRLLGDLDAFHTVPSPLDLDYLRSFELKGRAVHRYRKIYAIAGDRPENADVAGALKELLDRHQQ
jgi:hypothetical protein